MKRRLLGIAIAAGLCVSLTAQAGAHNRIDHRFFRGYYGTHAVVTGTVTSASDTSFDAEAYVIMPGAGGSSSTPTETSVVITPGTGTKLVVNGQVGAAINTIASGDKFYAIYSGVSASAGIATITSGTPTFVTAFVPPTPKFVVAGTITVAPTSDNPNEFTAIAEIVQPRSHGRYGYGRFRHRDFGGGYAYSNSVSGFSIGHGVNGDYGYTDSSGGRWHHWSGNTNATWPTKGVLITVDVNTKFDVNGDKTATASDLTDGQRFVAVFAGSPSSASLSSLPPALAVYARTVYRSYGFVGSVVTTDTTDTPNTITVDVTKSSPWGLFSGDQTFEVGSSTQVFTKSGDSLADVNAGDVVAGGLIAPVGDTATELEALPLNVLVDPAWGHRYGFRHTEAVAMARVRTKLRHARHHRK